MSLQLDLYSFDEVGKASIDYGLHNLTIDISKPDAHVGSQHDQDGENKQELGFS